MLLCIYSAKKPHLSFLFHTGDLEASYKPIPYRIGVDSEVILIERRINGI